MKYPLIFLTFLVLTTGTFADSSPVKTYAEPTGVSAMLHSHNDYQQKHPLDTALENGYRSVEVDVTDRWGEIRVTHIGFFTDGTMKEMYLDRLQAIVNDKGSVYGDGKRFYLWIELRPYVTGYGIVPMLRNLLPKYSMFAQFDETGKEIVPGPVEAILINSTPQLDQYFEEPGLRPACRGVHAVPLLGSKPPKFSRWAYIRWGNEFFWDGRGTMPPREEARLRALQTRAHIAGLKTRFWEVPDREEFWKQVPNLPFDLVGTDHLASTMATVREVSAPMITRMPASKP